MSVIFPGSPGVVGMLIGQDAIPVTLALSGLGGNVTFGTANVMKAILTSFDMHGSGNVQIGHTLRQKIYATIVGGERAGGFQAGGIWFGNTCPGNNGTMTGVDNVLAFYESTRFSTSGTTMTINLGSITQFTGILREFRLGAQDAVTGTGGFTLIMDLMPRNVIYAGPGGPPAIFGLTAAQIDGLLGNVITGVTTLSAG